ncbi:MAG: DNA polymerase III subunit alpha [Clostridia bacterium]|nr:DNA polymerase III subunit alpha [Clostridia bacterium]
MSDFVHLHLHTEYSLLDGATRIDKLFDACKKKGMDTVAITDHGNMFGTLYFAEEAKKAGIKYIIGCEMYVCDDYTKKLGKPDYDHLILLCKNKIGYKNLIKLDSIAYVDGFHYKPRIDYKTLAQYSEGLICLSGCLAGRVSKRLVENDYEGAVETAKMLRDIYKDDFYIEIQDHGLADQKRINPLLVKLSRELDIPLAATNDVHYLEREDAEMQDVVMCISMKTTLDDPTRLKMESDQSYLKSPEEMASLFPYAPEAISNTVKIAEKVTEEVFNLTKKGEPIRDDSLIPKYTPDDGSTPKEYLRKLTEEGLKKKYKEITPEIRERVEYEFDVISSMGFCDYYLIVWDFINYARSVGIPVGAGRGSGVSSIVAYSIGITDVEPLKYQLIFERFLNRERVSMPDFDVDISDARRGEVVEYVRNKYGSDRVAQIITFGTLASKAAIKDVARVYRVPYAEVDKVTKLMDGKSNIKQSLGLALTKDGTNVGVPDLIEIYNNDETLHKIIDMAIKVEGLPRNTSMHAAGVVICEKPIMENVPLQRNGDDITTQFDMIEVEALGMLKMDFLGLRTLTDVQLACQYVQENTGREIDFHEIGYEDQGTYELIGQGETDGVFQLESPGMKRFMKDLKPTTFEDIIAGISLYRPGPMDSIPDYIKNKHNPNLVTYDHPLLEPILKNSYGILVYQEQVMQICQSLGGFTLGHADVVRKAMGKKKIEIMEQQKGIFVYGGINESTGQPVDGAIKRGVPEDVAIKVYDNMKPFARYAFNKSHAAAYAVLAYQTAFLKRYYEVEFFCSLLNNRIDKIEELSKYLAYLKSKNITVLPPDINKSKAMFSCENGGIRFGLVGLKNVGQAVIESIVKEREAKGNFTSFEDFINRTVNFGINKRLVESLILAGAFDQFGIARRAFMEVHSDYMDRVASTEKKKNDMQISLFGTILEKDEGLELIYPNVQEYSSKDKLANEKNVLGVYLSGHPLSDFTEQFKKFSFNTGALDYFEEDEDGNKQYTEIKDGEHVVMGGIITEFKRLSTKNGQTMAFVTIEDVYGKIEVIFFPRVFESCKAVLQSDQTIKLTGKIQIKDGTPQIIAESAEKLEIVEETVAKVPPEQEYLGLIIPDDKTDNVNDILDIASSYPGDIMLIIAMNGKKYDAHLSVRRCDAFIAELKTYLSEEQIIFFKKTSKK